MNADNIDLWRSYKKENKEETRKKLVLKYLDLVKYQAGRINMMVPDHVEKEDLESYGIIGLMDAIEKFDPEKGNKFSSYAQLRIRGEIIDQLRKLDWLPHSLRRKGKKIKETSKKLEQKLGHKPDLEELASELEMSIKEIKKTYNKLQESEWVSLYAELGEKQICDFIADSEAERPENIYQKKQKVDLLAETIRNLNDDQRLVITLYYYEELTQVEIARIMDLSPARISQIHKKAVYRLRGFLGRKKEEFV